MKDLNLEEMVSMVEKLCKKGQAYRRKRMAAGEKSSAYLSGSAVKVCKGQMKGEGKDDGAMKKSAKGMAMYGKKAKMDEKNDPDNDDITIDPDTNFKLDLKHLLKKHKIDENEDLDEVEMTIQEVFDIDVIDENITEAETLKKLVEKQKKLLIFKS